MRLRALAPGKVNLCLFVGARREDGRHRLVTLFESVSLADEVELTTRVAMEDEVVCPGVEGPNIVALALAALRARGWAGPRVSVNVRKRIPIAGGMGGGSADAAATLRIASRLAPVALSVIEEVAAELGADVPSQLEPGLAIGTGAGELVEPVWPLQEHAFLIIPAGVALSTADVYDEADRLGRLRDGNDLAARHQRLAGVLRGDGGLAASMIVNDLQDAAVALCPAIEGALEAALEAGAARAFVCGSGPTVAGLFWGADAPDQAAAAAGAMAARFPGACAAVPVAPSFGFPLFA
jgi:4-diphosphocytidyl-2-C-methyl-D-erythritol kinase